MLLEFDPPIPRPIIILHQQNRENCQHVLFCILRIEISMQIIQLSGLVF